MATRGLRLSFCNLPIQCLRLERDWTVFDTWAGIIPSGLVKFYKSPTIAIVYESILLCVLPQEARKQACPRWVQIKKVTTPDHNNQWSESSIEGMQKL